MVGRRVQAANRCARSLADLTGRVDQLAVVLEAARVAVRTCRGDREVEREDPDDQSEPSRTGLQSNSGTGIGSDRKSTRLNSSHITISYAVFCLKKKKKKKKNKKNEKKKKNRNIT